MGKACRICDRKFFLRQSFSKYAREISYYGEEAQKLEIKIEEEQVDAEEMEE